VGRDAAELGDVAGLIVGVWGVGLGLGLGCGVGVGVGVWGWGVGSCLGLGLGRVAGRRGEERGWEQRRGEGKLVREKEGEVGSHILTLPLFNHDRTHPLSPSEKLSPTLNSTQVQPKQARCRQPGSHVATPLVKHRHLALVQALRCRRDQVAGVHLQRGVHLVGVGVVGWVWGWGGAA